MSCVPSNPDVSGIGVRIAIYVQAFMSFVPACWALSDGRVSESELSSLAKQSTSILLTAFAILITTLEQAGRRQVSNFHANIVLSLSWMNNTNAFIYFLLYVQRESEKNLRSTWSIWLNHIWSNICSDNDLNVSHFPASSKVTVNRGGITQARIGQKSPLCLGTRLPSQRRSVLWRIMFNNRIVLALGSWHLSMMASLGMWLWLHPASFGQGTLCAVQKSTTVILGTNVHFGAGGLRVWSLVLYALFLIPGLNLILPTFLFLSVFIGYHHWNQHSASAQRAPSPMMCRGGMCYQLAPIIIGLLLLFVVNIIFVVDIELTLRWNRHLQDAGETEWTFGQVLPILLLIIPSRDILETILEREEKRRRGEHTASLRNAIKEGAVAETIVDLIAKGADVNAKVEDSPSKWVTALQLASSRGDDSLVTLLLDEKAEIDVQGGDDGSILHAALREPHEKILRLLLDRGANLDIIADPYGTPLQYAASLGHEEAVNDLLAHKADPNIQGGRYGTALHAAACGGFQGILTALLKNSADPNLVVKDYGTVLQIATTVEGLATQRLEMVRLFLDAKANPNITSAEYGTALQSAAHKGHLEIVTLLLDRGADVNIRGGEYETALQAAACSPSRSLPVLELLLERGANPDIEGKPDGHGTALHAAAVEGQLEMVKRLLGKNAKPTIRGGRFDTVLQAAAASNEPDGDELGILRLLLGIPGVEPNVLGGAHWTALHAATERSNIDAVQLLVDKGADHTIRDEHDETALDIAMRKEYSAIVAIFERTAGYTNFLN